MYISGRKFFCKFHRCASTFLLWFDAINVYPNLGVVFNGNAGRVVFEIGGVFLMYLIWYHLSKVNAAKLAMWLFYR